MSKSILITGQGVMGKNYTRNLLAMAQELDIHTLIAADTNLDICIRIKEEFPELFLYHLQPDAATEQSADDNNIGRAKSLRWIIEQEKVSAYIGATQTDSHVASLTDALQAIDPNTGAPFITAILQEKPFGLFDTDNDHQRAALEALIEENNIVFNLDSILMFSGIWQDFENELNTIKTQGYRHISSECSYGKNRLGDNRPAHEGLFGTEGTHGLDIVRRQGMTTHAIQSVDKTKITQGFINAASPDVPYYCESALINDHGAPIQLSMALNFNKKMRRVTHYYGHENGSTMEIELDFDTNGINQASVDRMIIRSASGAEIEIERPAGEKLANALRASFSQNAQSVYGISNTNDLRKIMQTMREKAEYTQTTEAPPLIAAL